MNHDITNEVLTEFSTAFSSNPVNRIAMNAVTSAGLFPQHLKSNGTARKPPLLLHFS